MREKVDEGPPLTLQQLHQEYSDLEVQATPRSHSLEVEAGILSGQYVLYECLADCLEPVGARRMRRAGSQLAVPFAGVRYVYFRWARSSKTPFRSTQRFQAAAQLLSRPINNPEAGLQDVRGRTIERGPVGGRLILQFPGVQRSPDSLALSADLTVGYLPSPSDAIVQVSLVLF